MKKKNLKKLIILNIPYVVIGLVATNIGEAFRIAGGTNASEKVQSVVLDGCFGTAFANPTATTKTSNRSPFSKSSILAWQRIFPTS